MRVAVMDTETTGVDEEDQVVELAILTCEVREFSLAGKVRQTLSPISMFSTFVRPTVEVKPEARAVHHITDVELDMSPTMTELIRWRGFLPELRGDVVVAAHNLDFDERMLIQSLAAAGVPCPDAALPHPQRRLCTYRAARHLYPTARRHTNQYLRYWLGIDIRLSIPPHRACADVMVTYMLLRRMLEHATLRELCEMRHAPALLPVCPVGKFRGQPWESVDSGMLRWIIGRDFELDVLHTARHHLRLRNGAGS